MNDEDDNDYPGDGDGGVEDVDQGNFSSTGIILSSIKQHLMLQPNMFSLVIMCKTWLFLQLTGRNNNALVWSNLASSVSGEAGSVCRGNGSILRIPPTGQVAAEWPINP